MEIAYLVASLGELKSAQAETYKALKGMKETEEVLKQELMAKLSDNGLRSAKGEKYSASIASRSDIIVVDETAVVEWLKNEPNVEEDQYIGLKLLNFKPLANQVLKETGEIIPGTDRVIKESLSIKENK
jgi:hypothetical protein